MKTKSLNKYFSYLRQKRLSLLIILATMFVGYLIGNGVGYAPYSVLQKEYETIRISALELQNKFTTLSDNYGSLKTDFERTKSELDLMRSGKQASTPNVVTAYKYFVQFPTYDVATIGVNLGVGEKFEGQMYIWKAQGRERISPTVPGQFIFKILSPNHSTVIDAGRVSGEYFFWFEAKESGEYTLIFDDTDEKSIINLSYNSPAKLRDTSVKR